MAPHSLVLVFMMLTLAVLIAGLVVMAIGGKLDEKYSNKLMVARVVLQFTAIILLALLYFAYRK